MRRKSDPFKILISCLLSLRTKDSNTEKVSAKLFAVVDTPMELIKIPMPKLEKLIFSSGHYKKKARTLKHVSGELIGRFNSKVPETREELLSIKGIGPKTANIVLAFAFGQCVLPIDTHCHRIPNRIGWVKTKTPEQTEAALEKILPRKYWNEFNAIFVQFGKEICQPVSPWCSKCPIKKYCRRVGVGRSR
ncbi:MAG: endonuclease III [archaeon]